MPAPAVVYVAVAVGTVAAALAFKEFVYEPHLAPRLEAWAESFIENRRRSRSERLRRVPVLAPAFPIDRDENQARRAGDGKKKKSDGPDAASVELENLVSAEVGEWRSSVGRSQLRYRKAAGVMEESNMPIPYDPIEPTHVLFDSSAPSTPVSPQVNPFTSARSSPHVQPSDAPITRNTPSPKVVSPLFSARLPTPVSNRSPASSRATSPLAGNLDHSTSSMSSFTPAVIGPRSESAYGSPRVASPDVSEAGRSASSFTMPSAPASHRSSRPSSPFSDVLAAAAQQSQSPFVLSPGTVSDLELPSDDEDAMAMLSPELRSGMFSPSFSRDDPFEDVPDHGSDISWASVGRRTPEL